MKPLILLFLSLPLFSLAQTKRTADVANPVQIKSYSISIIFVFAFVLFSIFSSAQKNNPGTSVGADNFVSNVYDSITYRVTMGIATDIPGKGPHLLIIHDSILSYIRDNLKGVEVDIRKRQIFRPDPRIFLCIINAGNFKCYNEAIPLKEKLISDGYTGTFIHGFHCHADSPPTEDLRKITAKHCNEPEYLQSAIDYHVFPWDSIFFYVKVGTYNDSIPDSVLLYIKENLNDAGANIIKSNDETYQIIASYNSEGWYYCYADAVPLLKKIVAAGYEDAYIAAYICMNEMDVYMAKKIKENRCK